LKCRKLVNLNGQEESGDLRVFILVRLKIKVSRRRWDSGYEQCANAI